MNWSLISCLDLSNVGLESNCWNFPGSRLRAPCLIYFDGVALNTKLLALCLTFLFLGGCASPVALSPGQSASAAPSVDFLGQTQLPAGTKILYEESLIIGSGDNWVGRVMLDVGKDSRAAYSFFLEQYPQQGWTLLTAIRGKTSLLVFTKQDRSATVEMNEGNLLSSTLVTLTVTPKNATVTAPKKP